MIHAGAEDIFPQERCSVYSCQWSDCKKVFGESERFKRHLERHVHETVLCVYRGCEQEFSRHQDLLQHWRVDHKSITDDDIRQIPNPWRSGLSEPPTIPESIPGYLSINLHVHAGSMTKEHRKKLGPWVLRTNYGLPNLWRYNLAQNEGTEEEGSSLQVDEYDFLMSSSPVPLQFARVLQTHSATRVAASAESYIVGQPMPKER